ncbi:MAG: hypothetical protein IJ588_07115 [Prevotella sp.]|nr:hypothetical protein [Prevotella sp.]
MNRHFLLLLLLALPLTICAQAVQQGMVKTIGRPGKPGVPLGGVTIRVKGVGNAVLSSENGHFSFTAPDKKNGDAFVLLSVRKNGYELKDNGLIGRSQVFSTQVPVEISMVDTKQLEADRQRIERNAERVAEENYQKKAQEIEKQLKENKITAERYRQELQSLQDHYEKYLSLIGDMADRYARTDYDQLDSIDREINICIENGELDKADSLIHTVFDPETVLERNRAAKEEIQQRIAFAQSIIDKASADRAAILRDIDYARRVAVLCDRVAEEYMASGQSELARANLQKSLDIKNILYGEESEEAQETLLKLKSLEQ